MFLKQKNFIIHYGDLTDTAAIYNLISKVRPDEIYNLACPASPIHYQSDPVKTVQTNVLGSLNMLELAKKNNIECDLIKAAHTRIQVGL